MTLLYPIENSLYVNITNLCCCKCVFCVRDITDSVGGSDSLWLDHEPTIDELKAELEKFNLDEYEEVVFCGYGEPLMRINEVVEFANYIKTKKNIKIRVNTNGLADLIHKKKTAVLLKDAIDAVSISLNAQDEKTYNQISKPKIKNAYQGMLDFVKKCKENGIDTTVTIVTHFKDYEIDVEKCRQIANDLGVKFREREYLNNGY